MAQVVIPLAVLVLLAAAAKGVVRVFFLSQVVYWGVSFVGRSLLLLEVNPQSSFGDDIADPRLVGIGYDYGIAHVLAPVRDSLWIYVALVALFVAAQRLRGHSPEPLPRQSPLTLATFAAMWFVGILGRVALYLTGTIGKAGELHSANPYLQILDEICAIGAIGAILYFRHEQLWVELAVIGVLLPGELVWGIAEQSKTPFMGAVLALAVRFLSTGLSSAKFAGICVGGLGIVGLFGWLQSFKNTGETTHDTALVNQAYPVGVRPFLSIFRRFDLLEAATDTYYMNGQPWKAPSDVLRSGLLNLVPAQLGVTKVQSGPAWAQEVRGRSMDMSQISVSLADGHLNEGYLLAGPWGVVLESLFVIGMIAAVARCLRSHNQIVAIVIGLHFIALPAFSERGFLGITETLGKAVQQSVIALGLAMVIRLNHQLQTRAAPLAAEPVQAHPGRT